MVPRSPAGRGISSRLKKQEIVTSTRLGSRKKMPLTFATMSRRHQTGASASRRFATCWRCKFHICITFAYICIDRDDLHYLTMTDINLPHFAALHQLASLIFAVSVNSPAHTHKFKSGI